MEQASLEVQEAQSSWRRSRLRWLQCYEEALRQAPEGARAAVHVAAKEQAALMDWALEPGGPQDGAAGEFETAKHHLEHRWIEKTAFSTAERLLERMSDRVTERLVERLGEGVVARGAERVAERGVERVAEAALQRAGPLGAVDFDGLQAWFLLLGELAEHRFACGV